MPLTSSERESRVERPDRLQASLQSRAGCWWRTYRWWVVGLVATGGWLLTFFGFLTMEIEGSWGASAQSLPIAASDALYRSLVIFWFNAADPGAHPAVQAGRVLGAAAAVYAGAEFVKIIFLEQNQLFRARRRRDHTVICGVGQLGETAATALLDAGYSVTVIDAQDSPALSRLRARGAVTVIGDAASPETLEAARIARATFGLVCCGDDDMNSAVVSAILEDRGRPPVDGQRPELRLRVHIDSAALLAQLRAFGVRMTNLDTSVDFFNVTDVAATELSPGSAPLDGASGAEIDRLIVGTNQLALSLIGHIAERSVAMNVQPPPILTLVCEGDADSVTSELRYRFRGLEKAVRLETLDIDPDPAALVTSDRLFASDGRPRFAEAYVCGDEDPKTIRLALALASRCAAAQTPCPVVACVYGPSQLGKMLQNSIPHPRTATSNNLVIYDVLQPMGQAETLLADQVQRLAKACHAYYLSTVGTLDPQKSSHRPWEDLDKTYIDANRGQARRMQYILDYFGYSIVPALDWAPIRTPPTPWDPPFLDEAAQLEHDLWCDERRADGWTYGERDDQRRRTPSLVDWETLCRELPEQVEYDRSNIRNIPLILDLADSKIVARS